MQNVGFDIGIYWPSYVIIWFKDKAVIYRSSSETQKDNNKVIGISDSLTKQPGVQEAQ